MLYKDYPEDFEDIYLSLAISTEFYGDMEKKDMLYSIYQEKGREQLITFLKTLAATQDVIWQAQQAIEKSKADAEQARREEKIKHIARIIAGVEYFLGFLILVFNRNILVFMGGGLLLIGNRLLAGSFKSDRTRILTTVFTIGLGGFALYLNSQFLGPLPPREPAPWQGTKFPADFGRIGSVYIGQLHPVIVLIIGVPIGLLITTLICLAWERLIEILAEKARVEDDQVRSYVFYALLATFNAIWTTSLQIETPEEWEENYYWQTFILPVLVGLILSLLVINLWDGPTVTMAAGAAAIIVGLISFIALPYLMQFVRILFEPFQDTYH